MQTLLHGLTYGDIPLRLLAFAIPFFGGFMRFYFLRKLLPHRMRIWTLAAIGLVFGTWTVLKAQPSFAADYRGFMNIFINVFTFSIVIFLLKGAFIRRVIVHYYFILIYVLCESVAYVPIHLYEISRGRRMGWSQMTSMVQSNHLPLFFYAMALVPITCLLGTLSVRIWRRVILERYRFFYLLLLLWPMGQRYALSEVIPPGAGDIFYVLLLRFMEPPQIIDIFCRAGVAACIFASAVLLAFVLSQGKRAAMESELRETRRLMEREQARYREIQQRSDDLAKIRHDFNNQLASLIQLVRSGEEQSARDMAASLLEVLENVAPPGDPG
ncbi:MAG: hypothetical protein LBR77_09180 [Lachnospiraceae bacterium]|jgi:hypothetical protein|nr:hypothetical protein [Lachnospiraceae bacterium]